MIQQRQIVVNGILTSFYEAGSGPSVLLLHGWGDSSATFKDMMNSLSSRYHLIAIDLPGFGRTDKPAKAWSLNDYCEFIKIFLQKCSINNLHAVIGHSNGGAIALRGLKNSNIVAGKLILLASAGIRDEYKARKKIMRLSAKLIKILLIPLPSRVKNCIKKKAYSIIGSDIFVAEDMQDTFRLIISDDVRHDAAMVTLPTLLIYGSDDTATPVRYGEIFREAIKGSRLQVVQGAGHFVHHDEAKFVNTTIEDFLQ